MTCALMAARRSGACFGPPPWPVLRAGLRRWERAASDAQGCELVSCSLLASSTPWDIWSGTAPALVLLDVLNEAGWQHGQPPEEHTLVSPKRLRLGEMVTSKAYLSCLVLLEDLVLRGLRALRPGQPPK